MVDAGKIFVLVLSSICTWYSYTHTYTLKHTHTHTHTNTHRDRTGACIWIEVTCIHYLKNYVQTVWYDYSWPSSTFKLFCSNITIHTGRIPSEPPLHTYTQYTLDTAPSQPGNTHTHNTYWTQLPPIRKNTHTHNTYWTPFLPTRRRSYTQYT